MVKGRRFLAGDIDGTAGSERLKSLAGQSGGPQLRIQWKYCTVCLAEIVRYMEEPDSPQLIQCNVNIIIIPCWCGEW